MKSSRNFWKMWRRDKTRSSKSRNPMTTADSICFAGCARPGRSSVQLVTGQLKTDTQPLLEVAAPGDAAPYKHLQSRRDCVLQPRVARNELPWVMATCAPQLRRSCAINRNDACHKPCVWDLIIRGVGATSWRLRGWTPEVSQGSSLLATLGFIAESLWDSRSLASINIGVRCGAAGMGALR